MSALSRPTLSSSLFLSLALSLPPPLYFDIEEWRFKCLLQSLKNSAQHTPSSAIPATTVPSEHFLAENGTMRDHPRSFLPFGAGRRVCLGEAVAKADLFLIFTWFMQNYTFSKVPGKENESLINMIPKSAAGRLLCPYEILINKRE